MKRKNIFTDATLLLSSSLTVMAGAAIAPSLPQISRVFSTTEDSAFLAKLILTAPALVIAFIAPMAGWIIDHFGKKKLLLFSLLLYALAGSSGFYLNNLYCILAGRALLGVAISGTMTTTLALVADYFTGTARNKFIGTQGSFMAFGGIIFITLGGILADWHWRYPFLIYGFSLCVLPLVKYFIQDDGQITGKRSMADSRTSQYSKPLVSLIYLLAFISMLVFFIIPVQIPFLLQDFNQINNTKIGFAISIITITGAIISFQYQKIRKILSFQLVYAFSFLVLALGYFIISISHAFNRIIPGLIISGVGLSLLMPNTNLWLINSSPDGIRGRLIGGLSSSFFLGQFFSPIVAKPVIEKSSLSSMFAFYALFVLILSLAFFLYHFLKNRSGENHTLDLPRQPGE